VSGQQGETLRLFVTTVAPSYDVVAYRLGYYGDVGARKIWASGTLSGHQQPECRTHPGSNLVDCSNWAPSLSVTVGRDWPPGQYLFKLTPSDGAPSYVPFVVRDDDHHSDVLVISPSTTLAAYNSWGGRSFYFPRPWGGAWVSFDRPFAALDELNARATGWRQTGLVGSTYNVGMMLESMGLDVSYTTSVDQHQRPELMRNHRVIVTGAHDEYYSLEMRNGLEAARDAGVNLVFLGANAIYRRIHFEPSAFGPARHVVRSGSIWRDPPSMRPESTLTGAIYDCDDPDLVADMVIADADTWMFAGTDVTDGQRWPGLVQREFDRVNTTMPTPSSIQVLARSPVVCRGAASYSDMVYYTTPSGAGVFNSGTVYFEHRLGPLCPPAEVTPQQPLCQLRQMMANVFTAFAKGPAGHTHPSRPNLAEVARLAPPIPGVR
jgi:hypothetical protein